MRKCLLADIALFTLLSDLVCSALDFSCLLSDRCSNLRSVPELEDIAQEGFGFKAPNSIEMIEPLFI